ncbi:MAG: hypothetical protein ACK56J_01495 [Planctomycetota bacterium]|jgi:hypothetical protein
MKFACRPDSLSIEQLSELLSNAACRMISSSMLAVDIRAGAPANGDGTINLVHYAAWLAARSKD